MHRFVPLSLAAAALVAVMVALQLQPGPTPAGALTDCSASGNGGSATLLSLFNGARSAASVGALSASSTLNNAAQWMAEDVARMLSAGEPARHEPDTLGRSDRQRMSQCDVTGDWGENIAWGQGNEQVAFTSWMNSPYGHREAILGAGYSYVGFGQAGSIWVAVFSSTSGSSGGSPTATATATASPSPSPSPGPSPSPSPTLPPEPTVAPRAYVAFLANG